MPSLEIETCEVLISLFTAEINRPVDIVQEGFSRGEDSKDFIRQTGG